MPINLVITNTGRAALVNAANTGTLPVTITQIGIASVYTAPAPTLAALPSELKRLAAVSGQIVADDTLHVSLKDESADSYILRSIALYLGDGTLFACAGQPDPILNKVASAVALAAFDIVFDDIDAASISFGDTDFMMPTATTETAGVAELATVAEAQAGIDALRALTPASAKAAVLVWILAQDGGGSGLDADLLDGQHGSWYADIVARLGYTPISKSGDVVTNPIAFTNQDNNPIATRPNGETPLVARGNGTGPAVMTFHRGGSYATFLGLDTDNRFKLGGWSLGAQAFELWHAGNDGAGSGLDADLLDGQHGSWYADIAARLGFNPLNAASYTPADVIAKLLSVDGAGSGLDADLLDGQHGSWYADIVARLGYTPISKSGDVVTNPIAFTNQDNNPIATRPNGETPLVARGNGTGPAVMTFHRGGSYATFLGLDTDNRFKLGGWSLGAQAFELWHAGNDGAGSGLDADLFDGYDSTAFARIVELNLSANGGVRFANGLSIQWGRWISSAVAGYGVPVEFASPFSAEPFTLQLSAVVTSTNDSSAWADNSITGAGFTGRCSVASIGCRYLAIGKWN